MVSSKSRQNGHWKSIHRSTGHRCRRVADHHAPVRRGDPGGYCCRVVGGGAIGQHSDGHGKDDQTTPATTPNRMSCSRRRCRRPRPPATAGPWPDRRLVTAHRTGTSVTQDLVLHSPPGEAVSVCLTPPASSLRQLRDRRGQAHALAVGVEHAPTRCRATTTPSATGPRAAWSSGRHPRPTAIGTWWSPVRARYRPPRHHLGAHRDPHGRRWRTKSLAGLDGQRDPLVGRRRRHQEHGVQPVTASGRQPPRPRRGSGPG